MIFLKSKKTNNFWIRAFVSRRWEFLTADLFDDSETIFSYFSWFSKKEKEFTWRLTDEIIVNLLNDFDEEFANRLCCRDICCCEKNEFEKFESK